MIVGNEITNAVRSLRKRLGDTQQQFAHRLGMAISTVVRYELSRPPRGKVLADLQRLAENNGFYREAAIFQKAFNEEFDIESADLPRSLALRLGNKREEELFETLAWAFRYSENRTVLQNIEKQLEICRIEKAKFESAIEEACAVFLSVAHWAERDLPPETISERLSVSPELVRLWLTILAAGMTLDTVENLLKGIGLGESDTRLAADLRVPVSTVRALQKFRSEMGIPVLNRAQHSEIEENQDAEAQKATRPKPKARSKK